MEIPTTINPSFNRAIEHLLQFHPVFYLMGPALNMGIRPKGIRTDKDWQYYLDCLVSVMQIGLRNKWLHIHVDRRGRPMIWLLLIPLDSIKKDSRPIWTGKRRQDGTFQRT